MGISRGYTTPLAMDLMRAFKEGAKRGAVTYGVLGLGIGLMLGVGVTLYLSVKLEEKTRQKAE